MHQDNLYNGKWGKTMEEFSEEIRGELKNLNSDTVFVNPEPYQWYDLSFQVSLETDLVL